MNAIVPYRLNFTAKVDRTGLLRLQWTDPDECPAAETFHESLDHADGFNKVALDVVMKELPTGREFLEARPDEYTWGTLVLEHGKEFQADEAEPWQLKTPWRCFENTMELVRESGGIIQYAEGICVTPFGGLLHAWGVYNGRAVDTTWPAPHLNRYFGIVFEQKFLDAVGLNGGVFCRWDPVREYLADRRAS